VVMDDAIQRIAGKLGLKVGAIPEYDPPIVLGRGIKGGAD
jgi:hypothetical protein